MSAAKFRAALAATIGQFINVAHDGEITGPEWITVAVAAAGAALVWLIPNQATR